MRREAKLLLVALYDGLNYFGYGKEEVVVTDCFLFLTIVRFEKYLYLHSQVPD